MNRRMYQDDLDLLCRTREETIEQIRNLSETQFLFSPAARLQPFELPFLPIRALSPARPRWSVGEICDHLILFESVFRNDIATIIQLQKTGQDPELKLSFGDINVSFGFIPRVFLPLMEIPVSTFSQAIPNALVEFLTSNRLLPAQNPDNAAPRKGRRKNELLRELEGSLRTTKELFEANPDLDYEAMFRQHPTTGKQTVLEALRMIALHEQRHQKQIQEVVTDSGFPVI